MGHRFCYCRTEHEEGVNDEKVIEHSEYTIFADLYRVY
jgi:hypothetical protein